MQQKPVGLEDVVAWIRESLCDSQGRYEVQDLTFVRKAVRVVTMRRDAHFDLITTRWPELADPDGRPALTEDLRRWARRSLPGV